jgi:hypothetical protein
MTFFPRAADDVHVVVVGLDLVRVTAHFRVPALDEVRAERSLRKEGFIEIQAQRLRGRAPDLNEEVPDDKPLRLAVRHLRERRKQFPADRKARIEEGLSASTRRRLWSPCLRSSSQMRSLSLLRMSRGRCGCRAPALPAVPLKGAPR